MKKSVEYTTTGERTRDHKVEQGKFVIEKVNTRQKWNLKPLETT